MLREFGLHQLGEIHTHTRCLLGGDLPELLLGEVTHLGQCVAIHEAHSGPASASRCLLRPSPASSASGEVGRAAAGPPRPPTDPVVGHGRHPNAAIDRELSVVQTEFPGG